MTKKKKVHIIVNPAAGVKQPILFLLNKAFQKNNVEWSISLTKKSGDAEQQARDLTKSEVDVVAVFGGDGTVVEAATGLYKSSKPLAILPGGTANVIAKDLGIPIGIPNAIERLLISNYSRTKRVDMAEVNSKPFFLHVSVGIFSDLIKETTRELKNLLGQTAYGIGIPKILQDVKTTPYCFSVDGKKHNKTGVGLHVANSGNTGIMDISFAPNMSMTDGRLDVIFVKELNIQAFSELTTHTLLDGPAGKYIEHIQGKHIHIEANDDQTTSCDDEISTEKSLDIHVAPRSLSVVLPNNRT